MFFVCLSACISRELGYMGELGIYIYCTSDFREGEGEKKSSLEELLWAP